MSTVREYAEVVGKGLNTARVRLKRSSACTQCESYSACFSLAGESRDVVIEVNDALGVKVGDWVEIRLDQQVVMTSSALAYMVPVLGFIAGAVAGHWLGPGIGLGAEPSILLFGFAALAAALASLVLISKKLGAKPSFTPDISRIVGSKPVKDTCPERDDYRVPLEMHDKQGNNRRRP